VIYDQKWKKSYAPKTFLQLLEPQNVERRIMNFEVSFDIRHPIFVPLSVMVAVKAHIA